jgi:hypothetical protein
MKRMVFTLSMLVFVGQAIGMESSDSENFPRKPKCKVWITGGGYKAGSCEEVLRRLNSKIYKYIKAVNMFPDYKPEAPEISTLTVDGVKFGEMSIFAGRDIVKKTLKKNEEWCNKECSVLFFIPHF